MGCHSQVMAEKVAGSSELDVVDHQDDSYGGLTQRCSSDLLRFAFVCPDVHPDVQISKGLLKSVRSIAMV